MATDPKVAAVPLYLGTMAVEAHHLRTQRDVNGGTLGYEPRDTAASISMGLGNLVIGLGAAKLLGPLYDKVRKASPLEVGEGLLGWTVAMVGWDLLYYWDHRLSHEHRIGWANHVTHHSSQRYNLSTALRQPWSGIVHFWTYLPLPFLGVSARLHGTAAGLNLVYQYWIHTEAIDRLPEPFEMVFNTPSHHRVHHGANPQYLDRNYAGILILWDRLFGSFEAEDEPVTYGLTKNIDTHHPIRIAYHEFLAMGRDVTTAATWNDRIGHLVRGPGWAPPAPVPLPA